ncbi:MAG: DUF3151 family protein [Acidimicrobiales bacterium]
MDDETNVTLSKGLPETVLPSPPAEWTEALEAARRVEPPGRLVATAAVASAYPRFLAAWAELADLSGASGDHVAAYAYARVGYHRGLDALRGAGWRGTGYVRWREAGNRGFLASVDALRREAAAIGERDEEERCELLCYQLDPGWGRSARS